MMKTRVNQYIMLTLTLVSALLLLSMVSAQSRTGGPRTEETGDADEGKKLYLKYSCYACHGFTGQTGRATRLAPARLPLQAFIEYVRDPAEMPPYSEKVLSDAELTDIWAYLKAVPESPSADEIPLLRELGN